MSGNFSKHQSVSHTSSGSSVTSPVTDDAVEMVREKGDSLSRTHRSRGVVCKMRIPLGTVAKSCFNPNSFYSICTPIIVIYKKYVISPL
ncbi:hypothetical protein CRE_31295 [Caenorhabditis remanei]|uniref:Uncharacterized protein n=1 Tax=Caenorhabditis remanei TaxID=31234 RepID=E3MLP6_CAERE|nr:hypothetical protein CRE_31295 [Caenorhabditis remanei]